MNKFIKDIIKAFLIGIVIFIVLSVIGYLNGYRITSFNSFMYQFGVNQMYSVVLYMVNGYFIDYYRAKHGRNFFESKHLFRAIAICIAITLVTIFFLRIVMIIGFEGVDFMAFIDNEKPGYYIVAFIISMVVISSFFGFYYYKYSQETKVTEQKKIAGSATARFDALKNQLDPHFLFNSLNVLTSLIEENPEAATRFTTALSKVYRYVLEQKNKDLVPVTEELEFAKLYMSLLKMRFEDGIVFTMPETVSNPEAKVVPLSLQLLLENAVKHNVVTPSKKLHIKIEEQDGNLVVMNNIQKKQVIKKSSGVGLMNIQQRYKLLTERPVTIVEDTSNFAVAVPLLTRQSKVMHTQENFIENKRYQRAKERVEKIKGFYVHFAIYLIFVVFFIYLNLRSTDFPWAIFPILGWGIGILGHASEVFNYNPFLGRDWERRKMKEFMDKDNF
ncbi:MAG: 2TM domain-containing protein [Gilvibacter sp.]